MYCYGTEPFYSQDSYSAQFQVILQQLPIGALHVHKYILLESIFSVTINACPYTVLYRTKDCQSLFTTDKHSTNRWRTAYNNQTLFFY